MDRQGDILPLCVQGGSLDLLLQADSTGATPSQLAIEKGHRALGLHLAEARHKSEANRRKQRGMLGAIARAHMAPLIWAVVIGLVSIFL